MHLRSSKPGSRFSLPALLTKDTLRFGAAAAVLLASSCSVLYDLSPDQCGNNKECARFGSGFTCEEGLCVASAEGGRPSGGRGGGGGTGEPAGTAGIAGTDASGGTAGTAGSAPMAECATNEDCFVKNGADEPWACIDGECKALLTPECPITLPIADLEYKALRDTNAMVIGAFSRLDDDVNNPGVQNYDLALSEINEASGGIATVKGRRKVVAVVCGSVYGLQRELLVPVDHLISDLKVPAILAALDTSDQQYVFEERALAAGAFMMVPNASDDTVVGLEDGGLVHHMLVSPTTLATTYQPLIDMTITHLRNQGKLGPAEEARIALVTTTDNRFLNDLGLSFEQTVKWNGRTARANASAGSFVSVGTRSEEGFDQEPVADAVLDLAPHIVVGATGNEMTTKIMISIEDRWAEGGREEQDAPFYILSPFNYQGLRNALVTAHPSTQMRLLGINHPGALESEAYQQYKSAYLRVYPEGRDYDAENYYDAVYYLLYGMAAAGQQIRGEKIADTGIGRITSQTGRVFDVGAANVAEAFSHLASNPLARINLIGASGSPRWNAGGGREAPASVWCLSSEAEQTPYAFTPDVLRNDTESGMLEGEVPSSCFTFPEPEPAQ